MTICPIGTAQPGGRSHACTLLGGDDPEHLVPLLRRLHHAAGEWPSLIATLLEHDWTELTVDTRHGRPGRAAVTGVGYPASASNPLLVGRITDPVPGDTAWLYLIDLASDTAASAPRVPESRTIPVRRNTTMSDPDITHNAEPASGGPAHPTVTVQLSGTDGNAHMIIGKVAAALRREVGNEAADTFTNTAYDCTSFDQVLQLAMATVTVG